MSNPTPSRPHVQHNFDGDVQILNQSFDRRLEVRKIPTALQQDLQRMENRPTQIKAEIKLRVGGREAKEHSYTVTVTSSEFDAEDFSRRVPAASEKAYDGKAGASQDSSSSPTVPRTVNGQQATPARSTPRPELSKPDSEEEVVELRPFKRPRTDRDTSTTTLARRSHTDPAARDNPPESRQLGSGQLEDLYSFVKEWREEWVRQGGWLFDNITKANASTNNTKTALEKKLDSVQDVLGQSMNSASANTMRELTNISKLIPWLEQCRKTNADKVQAREEKWRTSSATFHDQARREREAAEKRIEEKLKEQKELLLKVARASGIDLDEIDAIELGSSGASDKSLGAQLTAELNVEAEKVKVSRSDTVHKTINIDDD